MKNLLQYNYDEKYDILYISKIPNEPSIAEEDEDGIVIRYSCKTNKFVGITIFDFKKRLINKKFPKVFKYVKSNYLYEIRDKLKLTTTWLIS